MDIASQLDAAGLEGRVVGEEFVALCPFHQETKPSLGVRLKDGVWHCLGCGQSGKLAKLLEALGAEENTEGEERVEEEDYNSHVSWKQRLREKQRAEGKTIRVVRPEVLARYKRTEVAYDYFSKRGLGRKVAELFDVRTGTGLYAGRVVLPVRDERGRLISLSGRSIVNDEQAEKMRKRKDSDSGRVLFGLYEIQNLGWPTKTLVVVEGEFDAISAVQAGFPCVAQMGARPTKTQLLRRLAVVCNRVVLCLDSTVKASFVKSVVQDLREYVQVSVAKSTPYKDLNEALVQGGEGAVVEILGRHASRFSV